MSKYKAVHTNGYASKKEARVAGELAILARAGKILDLREQVPFVIAEGRNKVRSVVWYADFTYIDSEGLVHICDVKGYRTPVYKLKKRLLYLLCGITIEEL